ncbi:MAG: hypothetical protein LBC92_03705, partial [Rickettsiales bacterium]|nr:hypothetical protein [Rickettsiales bacterium]
MSKSKKIIIPIDNLDNIKDATIKSKMQTVKDEFVTLNGNDKKCAEICEKTGQYNKDGDLVAEQELSKQVNFKYSNSEYRGKITKKTKITQHKKYDIPKEMCRIALNDHLKPFGDTLQSMAGINAGQRASQYIIPQSSNGRVTGGSLSSLTPTDIAQGKRMEKYYNYEYLLEVKWEDFYKRPIVPLPTPGEKFWAEYDAEQKAIRKAKKEAEDKAKAIREEITIRLIEYYNKNIGPRQTEKFISIKFRPNDTGYNKMYARRALEVIKEKAETASQDHEEQKKNRDACADLLSNCCEIARIALEVAIEDVVEERLEKEIKDKTIKKEERDIYRNNYIKEENEKREVIEYRESIRCDKETMKQVKKYSNRRPDGGAIFDELIGPGGKKFNYKQIETIKEVPINLDGDYRTDYLNVIQAFAVKEKWCEESGIIKPSVFDELVKKAADEEFEVGDCKLFIKDGKATIKKTVRSYKDNKDKIDHESSYPNLLGYGINVPEGIRNHSDYVESKKIFERTKGSLVAARFKELLKDPSKIRNIITYNVEESFDYSLAKFELGLKTPTLDKPTLIEQGPFIAKMREKALIAVDLYVRIKGEEVILKEQYKEALKKAKQKKDEKDAEIKSLI